MDRKCLRKADILSLLLKSELDFHKENSTYATHDFHAFAAKFPPQIPQLFIENLTDEGQYVLDPMVGSGTTMVEASLLGRVGIGFDLDPLAILICKVKTRHIDSQELSGMKNEIVNNACGYFNDLTYLERELQRRFEPRTASFLNYWFGHRTQLELLSLVLSIEGIKDTSAFDFFRLSFSSIIVTKSGGVTRARDLAHTRPHLDRTKIPKNAIDQFSSRAGRNIKRIRLIEDLRDAMVFKGDTRFIPLRDDSIDLVVTSPPYANAIDYMRAHKFSLVWFGHSIADLSALRADYIGSERRIHVDTSKLPDRVKYLIRILAISDLKRGEILGKYYVEMSLVVRELHRVLKKNSAAVIIIGTSRIRDLDVQTHLCLADIAQDMGFSLVGIGERCLDRDKRMLPTRAGRQVSSIEQRMHNEYVIGLMKE